MIYKIILHSDLEELEKEINVFLKQGFKLHGSLLSHNGNLCQAMTKQNLSVVVAKEKRAPRI